MSTYHFREQVRQLVGRNGAGLVVVVQIKRLFRLRFLLFREGDDGLRRDLDRVPLLAPAAHRRRALYAAAPFGRHVCGSIVFIFMI